MRTLDYHIVCAITLALLQPTNCLLAGGCDAWLAGPLDNSPAPNGTNDPGTISAPVQALTTWDPDGAGPSPPMLVAAGTFSSIQGVAANRIAVRDAITGEWHPLGTGVSIGQALAVHNDELYSADHIARWDGSNWNPLDGLFYHTCCTPGPCNCPGIVNAMLVFNGELVVGGHFTTAGGQNAGHVARWNGSSWSPMGTDLNNDQFSKVNALTVYNGQLFAGGSFHTFANENANVAVWNGAFWSPFGSPLSGPTDFGEIHAMTVFNGQLIVGGTIQLGEGAPVISIASWNGSTWQGLGTGVNQTVEALTVYNGSLIAGGYFNTAGGQPANKIARWNGSTWSALGSSGGGVGTTPNEHVTCLTVDGANLIVGGRFSTAGGIPANNLARWNGTTWSNFAAVPVSNVQATTVLGSRLVAGGLFEQPTPGSGGTTMAHNIATWNGTTLAPLGGGVNGQITALTSFTTTFLGQPANIIIAGGSFTHAGDSTTGVNANRVAQWTEVGSIPPTSSWSAMGAGFDAPVFALTRYSNSTVAGGSFFLSGSTVCDHIARWDPATSTWGPMGSGMNQHVRALVSYASGNSTFLVAGGDFTVANGSSANRIAIWKETFVIGGGVFTSPWVALGTGFNATVLAIERYAGSTYAAGAFTASGATALNRIARLNGSTWVTVGNGTGFNGTVRALKTIGTNLYASGDFTSVDGIAANRVARWNGTAWSAVNGGADASIFALASFQNELVVGGTFNTVSSPAVSSPGLARFSESGLPWIATQPLTQAVDCGDNASFVVQLAPGYPGVTYQWRKNTTPLGNGPTGHGSAMSGATTDHLTITNLASTDAGAYDCLITNSCGSVTSSAATLTTNACCTGDINHSGAVNVDDLLAVISTWGPCPAPPAACAADVNHDGAVNVDDMLVVIAGWGACP